MTTKKNAMTQTSELFALLYTDIDTGEDRFVTRSTGGVATYRTYGMAHQAQEWHKKGMYRPFNTKIVRFLRDGHPTRESDWWEQTGKIVKLEAEK
jgi:hypothetical protein|nr:MAG TPA: hypothetical protein [Caudoviricetes sp.]